jgi:hypothetical protein
MRKKTLAAGITFALCSVAAFAGSASTPNAEASDSFSQQLLDVHNLERKRLGVPDLKWDKTLASKAEKWAQKMASSGTFEHDSQTEHGENLWMGTASSYVPQEMVGGWIDERKDFKSGVFPDVSRTPNWQDVGHYTQLIWKTTTHVGCAKAAGKTDDYLVCRYSPPGNVTGTVM